MTADVRLGDLSSRTFTQHGTDLLCAHDDIAPMTARGFRQPAGWLLALAGPLLLQWASDRLGAERLGAGLLALVVTVAVFFGLRIAAMSAAMAVAVFWFQSIPPAGSWRIESRGGVVELVLFTTSVLLALVLVARLERAVAEARLAERARLDAETRERERLLREAIERERYAVALVQRAALPVHLPELPGYELGAAYLPATQDAPVGGDWYDAFVLPDDRLVVVIGDVAGHGQDSALRMLQARTLLFARAADEASTNGLFAHVNDQLVSSWDPPSFATCAVVVLHPMTGRVEVASAGHPLPLHCANGVWSPVVQDQVAPPLGAFADAEFHSLPSRLGEGETLVLFTDGLVESRDRSLDEGVAHLAWLLDHAGDVSAQELCDHTIDSGAEIREDDACILALRRLAP